MYDLRDLEHYGGKDRYDLHDLACYCSGGMCMIYVVQTCMLGGISII